MDDVARKRILELEKKIQLAKQAAGFIDERERDALRKRESRQVGRVCEVPWPEDLNRRRDLEQDDESWLMHYFGKDCGLDDPFTYRFTLQQKDMIAGFGRAIQFGGDQSVAASRGEGKSTICERIIIKYSITGLLAYSVILQASGDLAFNSLDTIKIAFEENELLRADYPEVCLPVLALENTPQRAHYMLVSGKRLDNEEPYFRKLARFSWSGPEIILPNVPGAPSSKAIIATRGLDGAIRGLKKKGKRPQLAAIDDPDTEITARNEEQAKKLEDRIEKAIGFLGSQTRPITRIMLTTIQSRKSVAFKFTDKASKPSWHGKRYRFLINPPERLDLWDEYILLKQEDWRNDTELAHEFFVENRDEMQRGAEVANPNRYAQGELCALQHYYNQVAEKGPEAIATEYDNDPPEETELAQSQITADQVRYRVSGFDRCVVPAACSYLVRGVDVGKYGLHWVVRAFMTDGTSYVIDYGIQETHGAKRGTDDGLEHIIRRAINELDETASEYRRPSYEMPDGTLVEGELVPVSLTLVDVRYCRAGVIAGCFDNGPGWLPAMGHGKSSGCCTTSFRPATKEDNDTKPGDGWYVRRDPQTDAWIVHADTDRWKEYEHARWMTSEGKAGAAYLFGSIDESETRFSKRIPQIVKEHMSFAKHITAELKFEDIVNGKLVERWRTKAGSKANHYFDGAYLTQVAGSMRGVRLLAPLPRETPKQTAVISEGTPMRRTW